MSYKLHAPHPLDIEMICGSKGPSPLRAPRARKTPHYIINAKNDKNNKKRSKCVAILNKLKERIKSKN